MKKKILALIITLAMVIGSFSTVYAVPADVVGTGGNIYLDGGFYDNLPFKMLLDKGYEDLIIVRTHAPGFTKKVEIGRAHV